MNYEKSILYNPKIIYCVATVFSNFGSSLSYFVSVIYIARSIPSFQLSYILSVYMGFYGIAIYLTGKYVF